MCDVRECNVNGITFRCLFWSFWYSNGMLPVNVNPNMLMSHSNRTRSVCNTHCNVRSKKCDSCTCSAVLCQPYIKHTMKNKLVLFSFFRLVGSSCCLVLCYLFAIITMCNGIITHVNPIYMNIINFADSNERNRRQAKTNPKIKREYVWRNEYWKINNEQKTKEEKLMRLLQEIKRNKTKRKERRKIKQNSETRTNDQKCEKTTTTI